jgi:DMSO/TMAO reductase YedYZ molybdopterin-dependent catalytic subunit
MTIPGKDLRLTPYGDTNLGMSIDLIDSLTVPNELFFVRSNGPIPTIDPDEWQLEVIGEVDRPVSLSLRDLKAMTHREHAAFLECTGNGRSRFDPPAEGTTWQNDAAGNALWGGVALADVLDLAGVKPSGVEVVSQGADLEDMRRGLPMSVARDPGTLLAYEMNGEPLPTAHGAPVRLLVPRWAGIASTKWLVALEVWDHPFTGHFQGELYVVYDADCMPVQLVREMPVKSIIATPSEGSVLAPGEVAISGYAWSGYAPIDRVDVSADGGETWVASAALESAGPYSWTRWEVALPFAPGSYQLMARATDARGISQPYRAVWNKLGYFMNEMHRVRFAVHDPSAEYG